MKAVVLAARPNPPRLYPFTETRPKSMIPIAGTRILEWTIQSLKEAGIYEIILVVNYKQEQIREYFG